MASNFHDALDPLDLEILERALDGALGRTKHRPTLTAMKPLKANCGKSSSRLLASMV